MAGIISRTVFSISRRPAALVTASRNFADKSKSRFKFLKVSDEAFFLGSFLDGSLNFLFCSDARSYGTRYWTGTKGIRSYC